MIIFITFCIVILIQIFFYFFLFGKFYSLKSTALSDQDLSVSVIICVKNEAENLKINLPEIAKQQYAPFEIVLVDDASSDNSPQEMQQFKNKFSSDQLSIHIISIIKKDSKGKKAALSKGIHTAKNDYLVLTDADCKPVSSYWLKEITTHFTKEQTIVLGYGAYKKIKNSFLNKLIRFETLLTAIQYFSYAKAGKAYMGVGRNIAYRKNEFIKVDGFNKHLDIVSGDDDLFINQISTKKNTDICFTKNSFTISNPETDLHQWIRQKRRHITTSGHYKKTHQFMLGLFYISQILFGVLAILLLALKIYPVFTIILIFIRYIIWYMAMSRSAKKLNEKDLLRFSPIYEISIIFIQLYIFIRNMISSPKQW